MRRVNSDVGLGVFALIVALAAIFLWIPADTGTGIVQKMRGRLSIGDAFAPTIAFAVLALSSCLLLLESRHSKKPARLTGLNCQFLIVLFLVFLMSFTLMRWTGPLAVWLAGSASDTELSYRALRDTAPWKYIGYLTGGTMLVGGLIALINRCVTWRTIAIGLFVSAALAAIYDLPFEDLLLPPNGDL